MKARPKLFAADAGADAGLMRAALMKAGLMISFLVSWSACKVALGEPLQTSGEWISPSSITPSPDQSTPSADYVRKPTDPPPFDPATPPAIDPADVRVTTFPAEGDTDAAGAPPTSDAAARATGDGLEPSIEPGVAPKAAPGTDTSVSARGRADGEDSSPAADALAEPASADALSVPSPPQRRPDASGSRRSRHRRHHR
jgi:hypothetical protein